jgi:molybdate transport system ATP-binding protein
MIDLRLELALASFVLSVEATLTERLTAVMGPSGAGKTSLLEAIAGLRPKARGRVALDGVVVLDDRRAVRLRPESRRLGYVPQDAGLFPHLTALDNIRFGARGDRSRVDGAIDTLEVRPLLDRFPVTMSGGERQRVALARALATEPRLLLLDEPLAALDVGLRDRVLPYLLRIRDEWGVPMLYVTHSVGEVLALADHVVFLREGRVEAAGAPLAMLSSPALARQATGGIENLFAGSVVSHDPEGGVTRVRLDDKVSVATPLASARPVGSRVTLAIRAEDVLVAAGPVGTALSARNVYEARVVALERTGDDITLRLEVVDGGPRWLARLTPAAVRDLQVRPGGAAWLAVKSHSIRLL